MVREGVLMYTNSFEEERDFLDSLWKSFNDWSLKRDPYNINVETERFFSNIVCPKCHSSFIVNIGKCHFNNNRIVSYSMEHICDYCGEKFDRVKIGEEIYDNIPKERVKKVMTPLGDFQVIKNGKPIEFKYWTFKTELNEKERIAHQIDVDTSLMLKDDKVFAGIIGAGFDYRDGDERCVYLSAENKDCFLVLNAEQIDDFEVDIEDYSFISTSYDENGAEYLIHKDPQRFINEPSHLCRTIKFTMAWGDKTEGNYEEEIEMTAW